MSLSEWTIRKTHTNIKTTLTQSGVIGGSGSLLLEDGGVGGDPQATLMRMVESERSFTAAKMRTLMRINTVDGAGAGFVFLLDQENIIQTEGNFYGVFAGRTRVAGTTEIVLAKFDNGLQNPPSTTLYHAAYNVSTRVFALEVEWQGDLGAVGGTRIIIRRSSPSVDALTFDNLSTVYDAVDVSSPFLTSKGEGLVYHNVFGGANSFTLDKTSMIKTT